MGVLLLLFDLEIFMWGKVKWTLLKNYSDHFFVKSCEYHPNASEFVHLKGILNWIKIKWIFSFFLSFAVTFKLENFHRGGEVKWDFFQKPLDNFLWKFGNSILMPLTLCTQKKFLIESNLNGFFFSVTFGLRNFHRGEGAFYSTKFCKILWITS